MILVGTEPLVAPATRTDAHQTAYVAAPTTAKPPCEHHAHQPKA